jgi:hypothetical protein
MLFCVCVFEDPDEDVEGAYVATGGSDGETIGLYDCGRCDMSISRGGAKRAIVFSDSRRWMGCRHPVLVPFPDRPTVGASERVAALVHAGGLQREGRYGRCVRVSSGVHGGVGRQPTPMGRAVRL